MLCADCGQNKATVHFTQIVNDETETFHLCPDCAQSGALKTSPVSSQVPLSDFLSEMGAPIFTKATNANTACPRCGCTFRQFRKTGRLGCAHCYATFGAGDERAPAQDSRIQRARGHHVKNP